MAKPAKTSTAPRYREDLPETPEWIKKKKCPSRDKYMAGKRILPKNMTGREKLADLVDETCFSPTTRRAQGEAASCSRKRCSSRMSRSV